MISVSGVLITIVFIAISYFIVNYRRRLPLIKAANVLPGPKTLPLIGNANYLIQRNSNNDFLQRIYILSNTYPSPFRFWLGNKLLIIINEPEHVKIVLQSRNCLEKSTVYRLIEPALGQGLITAPVSVWTLHRKIVISNFNTNMLRSSFDIFIEHSLTFVDELEKIRLKENEVDLFYYIKKHIMDIVFETMMGVKLNSQTDKGKRFATSLMRLKELLIQRVRNIFLYPDIFFYFSRAGYDQRRKVNFIHSIADEIIEEKMSQLKQMNTTEADNKTVLRPKFLDLLIKAHNDEKITRREIHDETITTLIVGNDTIAVTMHFVIFLLANFPEVQKKVHKELSEIYGTEILKSAPIKYEDLEHMNYLECVIKETMRLFPVAPLIGRHLTKDLKLGEYTLPKGADVVIQIFMLHRNEKYWPNPLLFDPDRFLPENATNRHPYSYIPFSNGPRNCLGTKYSMVVMKVILASMLRTFEVNTSIKMDKKIYTDTLLSTMGSLKVKIKRKDYHQERNMTDETTN